MPGSLDEARRMVEYNQTILDRSLSPQRRHRAARMLVNLGPHVARLEADERTRVQRIEEATPPASTLDGQLQRMRDRKAQPADDVEFETVWNGAAGRAGASLCSWPR